MKVSVFLMCYNEALIIRHAIEHYQRWIPGCSITVYDNYSTDSSASIARDMGCAVVQWKQRETYGMDDTTLQHHRNTCWAPVKNGWVIVCDMDEWLCVTPVDLEEERARGTTVLKTFAVNVVGDSGREDLTDIDVHSLDHGRTWKAGHKSICFDRQHIQSMRYGPGSHHCNPLGKVAKSARTYLLKHMQFMGVPYYSLKMKRRDERNTKHNISNHYTSDDAIIRQRYDNKVNNMAPFAKLVPDYALSLKRLQSIQG